MAQKHNTVSTTDMARRNTQALPREGDAEPGQRQWANLRYPADENAVDNVVEEVDDLCKNARDGET